MPDPRERLPLHVLRQIDAICDRFEAATQAKSRPRVEDYLEDFRGGHLHVLLVQLLRIELEARARKETLEVIRADFQARFPSHPAAIEDVFNLHQAANQTANDVTPHSARSPVENAIRIHCPHCNNAVELAVDSPFVDIECTTCGSHFSVVDGDSGTRDAAQIARIGRFELIERLGLGGFGAVWKARDKRLDRTVAVKIPRKGQLRPEEQEKFLREARAAAQLHHPNIVAVHEVGRDGDADSVYIVSEIVRGVSLSDWITAKKLTTKRAAGLCATIADALAHAHDRGVVHRDLKPQNIILDNDQAPHLTDFGLAKREGGEITMTVDGQVLGTPAYMPPEQATGDAHSADGRSDIYSLGVILFQLLTGELPFRGNTRMLIHQVVHDDAPSPRKLNASIPRDLETICLKCLEKEPGNRYQTARELANDLNSFLRNEPISARPISPLAKGWRWCQRNAVVASLIAAVLASLLAGLIVSSYLYAKMRRNYSESVLTKLEILPQLRVQGYRDEVWSGIEQIRRMGSSVDLGRLRSTAIASLGDFVGLKPVDHNEFADVITAFTLHPTEPVLAVAQEDGSVLFLHALSKMKLGSWSTSGGHPVVALRYLADGRLACVERVSGSNTQFGSITTLESLDKGLRVSGRVEIDKPFDSARHCGDGKSLVLLSKSLVSLLTATGQHILSIGCEDIHREMLLQRKSENGEQVDSTPSDLQFRSAAYASAQSLVVIAFKLRSERGVVLWDTKNKTVKKIISIAQGNAYFDSMAFSPDERYFVLGTDRSLRIFDVSNFEQRMLRTTETIKAVAFSSDQQFFATVDMRGQVSKWSVSTGNEVAKLEHPIQGTGTEHVHFSADMKLLAASNNHSIRVWHIDGISERQLLPAHKDAVTAVDCGQNGRVIVTGSKDASVSLYDVKTGRRREIRVGGAVQSVCVSPSGSRMALGHWGPKPNVEIWDISGRPKRIAFADHDYVRVHRMAFIQEELLAAACMRGIAIWSLDQLEDEIASLSPKWEERRNTSFEDAQCFDVTSCANGQILAWTEWDGDYHIRVVDFGKSEASYDLNVPKLFQGWHALAFFPNSKNLLYVNRTGQLQTWDIDGKNEPALIGAAGSFSASHIALSDDGEWLAGLRDASTVHVKNLWSKEEYTFRSERAPVYSIDWSPKSPRLVVGLNDGGLISWDLAEVESQLALLKLADE